MIGDLLREVWDQFSALFVVVVLPLVVTVFVAGGLIGGWLYVLGVVNR